MCMMSMRTSTLSAMTVIALLLGVTTLPAFANHNPALVNFAVGACGETTFDATITDPAGTHKVANMRLVVHADSETQFTAPIPTNGDAVSVTVGPFYDSPALLTPITIMWRVFGGGERSYDDPLWNGFGGPTFSADVNAYGAANGFGWVIAGPDDPNPFTTWHMFDVEPCALTKDMCKDGGWEALGFRNQGQCIRFVNTGQDSR